MTDRSATASVLAELAAGQSQPVHLFEVLLDGGAVRNTDAYSDIEFDGNTYVANGHFVGFDAIEETADMQITRVRGALSGIDQTWTAVVLQQEYIDRIVRIYKGFLDAAGVLIADPILIFDGRIDEPVIEEDPEAGQTTVSLSATSLWVDFERRPGRHTNHTEQSFHFPGDRAFERVGKFNRQIIWGRK